MPEARSLFCSRGREALPRSETTFDNAPWRSSIEPDAAEACHLTYVMLGLGSSVSRGSGSLGRRARRGGLPPYLSRFVVRLSSFWRSRRPRALGASRRPSATPKPCCRVTLLFLASQVASGAECAAEACRSINPILSCDYPLSLVAGGLGRCEHGARRHCNLQCPLVVNPPLLGPTGRGTADGGPGDTTALRGGVRRSRPFIRSQARCVPIRSYRPSSSRTKARTSATSWRNFKRRWGQCSCAPHRAPLLRGSSRPRRLATTWRRSCGCSKRPSTTLLM